MNKMRKYKTRIYKIKAWKKEATWAEIYEDLNFGERNVLSESMIERCNNCNNICLHVFLRKCCKCDIRKSKCLICSLRENKK